MLDLQTERSRVTLDRLDLNLLVVLDAMLRERSVTRVAHALHLSQPAISGSMARLREHFGDELIHRKGRDAVLTPFALALVEPVSRIIRDVRALRTIRPQFDAATTDRRFRIVASDYIIDMLFPEVIKYCVQHAPNVSLFAEIRRDEHEAQFVNGEIDLVVCPDSTARADEPSESLFDDELVCVVWKENDEVQEALEFSQYLQMRHVVRTSYRHHQVTSIDEAVLRGKGQIRRVAVSVPSFGELPRLVVGTPYVATVQKRIVASAGRSLPLRVLPCPFPIPHFKYVLQWPRFLDHDPAIAWLRTAFHHAAHAS